jgi:hypothetical protein
MAVEQGMSNTPRNMHSEASLNRRLVLFATQLEGYLAHFPHCHKYTITQGIRPLHPQLPQGQPPCPL